MGLLLLLFSKGFPCLCGVSLLLYISTMEGSRHALLQPHETSHLSSILYLYIRRIRGKEILPPLQRSGYE